MVPLCGHKPAILALHTKANFTLESTACLKVAKTEDLFVSQACPYLGSKYLLGRHWRHVHAPVMAQPDQKWGLERVRQNNPTSEYKKGTTKDIYFNID